MASGIRTELVNRYNVSGSNNGLSSAYGVHSLTIGDHTYVYVAAQYNDAITVFELEADGSLTPVESYNDTTSALLDSVSTLTSTTIGGSTYLFANANGYYGEGITSFKVNNDGTLTPVDTVAESSTVELDGTIGSMSVTTVGTTQFLIASGRDDDGVSVFRIGTDGTLVNTSDYDDASNVNYGLNGAMGVTTAKVGTGTYVFVAGYYDSAVTVMRLNANGTMTFIDTVENTGDLNLSYATELTTAVVNGTTYLFVGGSSSAGISVFSVAANGTLTNVFNTPSDNSTELSGVLGLETFTLNGQTYLMTNSANYSSLSYFSVGNDGSLTLVDTVSDDETVNLYGTDYSDIVTIDGHSYVIATGSSESGVSVFELGVENPIVGTAGPDFLEGTDLADTMDGRNGNDIISAYGGNDTVHGGNGADVILGGDGDDIIYGDDDNLQTLSNTVTVPSTQQQLSISATLPATSNTNSIDVSGFISRDAMKTSDFNIVYVIDVSGSMGSSFSGNETVPDMNGDGYANELIDGAITAYESVTDSLVSAGLSGSNLAVVAFSGSATTIYNGTVGGNVDSVLETLNASGSTYFEAALDQTITALNGMGTGENHVFFMSDGAPGDQGAYSDEVSTLLAANGLNATIRAIGLGTGANIDVLDLVDDGLDNDTAERVLTPSALTSSLTGAPVQASEVARIEILVNGKVVETIRPAEFTSTPLGLRYSATVNGLSTSANDQIVVRMVASDPAHTTARVGVTLKNAGTGDGDDILFGNDGSDTIMGNGGNDTIHGGHGDDVLSGMSGNDVLFGGAGADKMSGGTGNDVYYVNMARDTVTEYARGGFDKINSHISFSLRDDGQNVESLNLLGDANLKGFGNGANNAIFGNAGNNVLYGFDGNDKLYGNDGQDFLIGGNGNDFLYGGNGLDTMRGGAGNDIYFVESWGDKIVEVAKGGIDSVNSSSSFSLKLNGAFVENLNLTGKANINGIGNGLANKIEGNLGNNILNGLVGNDKLFGYKGNDRLNGGDGADRLDGANGNDILDGGNHNDALFGGNHNDTLYGRNGADSLFGGNGNDILQGNLGADRLNGGNGMDRMFAGVDNVRDVFDFNTVLESRVGAAVRDKIFQFDRGEDKIDLSGIDANTSAAGNQAFAFTGHVAKAHSVWWVDTGTDVVLRGDNNGNNVADFEIQINDIGGLNAGDVIL
ncbi:VWA domain-containing protein [uncultured Cohaesibacter sp.]|uniref:VWA domain-containing protein n=1 Tax=uncultured Cohaesibacter sp. TaxID=1002546 RepID=UPI002AAAA00C|nr:VWA domain-containing protein [uncultured Cohaesibacter sp.]